MDKTFLTQYRQVFTTHVFCRISLKTFNVFKLLLAQTKCDWSVTSSTPFDRDKRKLLKKKNHQPLIN